MLGWERSVECGRLESKSARASWKYHARKSIWHRRCISWEPGPDLKGAVSGGAVVIAWGTVVVIPSDQVESVGEGAGLRSRMGCADVCVSRNVDVFCALI